MKEFAKRLRSEQGFTLVELIAALTVFAMIVGLISGVTMYGFRSYHKISVQNALRDEADLIMSSIITELYTYSPERLQNISGGIELIKDGSSPRVIRVSGNKIVINGKESGAESGSPIAVQSNMAGSIITASTSDGRSCNVASLCNSGLIQIKLVLKYKGNETDKMELESQFGF